MNGFISSSDAKITLEASWISWSENKRLSANPVFPVVGDVISDKFSSFHLYFSSATVITRSAYSSVLKTSIKWLWDVCKMIKDYVFLCNNILWSSRMSSGRVGKFMESIIFTCIITT